MVFTSITQRKKTPGYSRVGSSLTHRRPILADPAVQCYTVKKRSSDERLALGVPTCVARWGHKCPRPASPHPCCVRRNRRTAVRRLCSCPPRPCLNKPRFSKVFQGFPPRPSLIKSVNKPTNQRLPMFEILNHNQSHICFVVNCFLLVNPYFGFILVGFNDHFLGKIQLEAPHFRWTSTSQISE